MFSFLAQAATTTEESTGFAKAFADGGVWMWFIAATGICVLLVTFNRAFMLYVKNKNNQAEFLANVRQFILSRNLDKAVQYASQDTSPLGRIVKAGLLKVNHQDDVVQSAMDEAALSEIPKLERWTGFLPILSNVATLLGLLGTIVGLIKSFEAAVKADAATKAIELSKGISEAMNSTAAGLFVAIPALLFYAVLQSRTQHVIDTINAASVNVINLVIINRDKLGLSVAKKEG